MNALQQRELEILRLCISVCERLNLRYYLVCGSALGAAKYGGFIPWDDDVDVGLPRPDYDRFLREAPALLPEELFLQNYRTDPQFPHIFSKLRDSRTTLIERGMQHLDVNHGVYIDVFPLDGYPQSPAQQRAFDLSKKLLSWKQYCALDDRTSGPKVRLRNRVFRLLGCHKRTARTLAQMEKLFRRYPPETSRLWCNHGNWQGKLEYADRSQYGQGTRATFEGVEVVIPERYDEYLTQKYGDWRSDPPPDKQRSHHEIVVLDVDKPYMDYLRNPSDL